MEQKTQITRKLLETDEFKEYLFANFSREFKKELLQVLPDYVDDPQYVFRVENKDNPKENRLIFIKNDDSMISLGCYYCMSDLHKFDTKKQLWIAGSKAIPATEELQEWPDDLNKIQMDSLNIWICPFCKQPITRWKIGI